MTHLDTVLITGAVILWALLLSLGAAIHFSHGKWQLILAREILRRYAIQQATLRFRSQFTRTVADQTPSQLLETIESSGASHVLD